MKRLILLGDSIFDNRSYVGGGPAVIDQVQQRLPQDWRATLLAVDGNTVVDIPRQLQRLPADATHLVLSVGGNDALGCLSLLGRRVHDLNGALGALAEMLADFKNAYASLMAELSTLNKPCMVCTIYDSVPGLDASLKVALALFNDIILRNAISNRFPVLDLRMVCTEPGDYSVKSPIEPSSQGGEKIAEKLVVAMLEHDFQNKVSRIFL